VWALACAAPLAEAATPPFVGDAICGQCHRAEANHYTSTPMARALTAVAQCSILSEHAELRFAEGIYQSIIRRDGDRSVLSVTDGSQTVTVPLLWAFGNGGAGQTYVFEYEGALYESRLSFYSSLKGLDLTMGATGSKPDSVLAAAGRRMDPTAARECFGCHATGAVSEGRLHLERLAPGVGCESCHGAGEKHTAAVRSGDAGSAKLPRLGKMTPEEMNELCGGCHRTWAAISRDGPRGVNNVRFQPYRLTNSKCYDPADARIRCTACHDPHAALETSVRAYDSRCVACHSAAEHTKTCPVGKRDCAGCHMPKVELPGSHATFTDHQIRVVRAGAGYPN
jgi:hypothetical protein